jgi:CRP-like cAMP-binding protein
MSAQRNAGNHFLASLSSQDNELLQAHLHHPKQLSTGTVIYDVDDTIPRVIFPYNGIISVVVALSGGQYIEAGMLGRNSVVGVGAALDGPTAFNRAIVQGDGTATAIDAAVLKRLADQSKTLRHSLVQHNHAAQAQTQQVAACNALHGLDERLCRWLLQSRDLLRSDILPLTQEFLSQMLGVQRSSVTMVARRLQEAGLISYRRGRIHVLDVEALQDACCECYQAINAHYSRLLDWSPDFDQRDPSSH